MLEFVLEAEPRVQTAKQAKKVRGDGKVPGVYYSRGEENLSIQVLAPNLDPLIYTSKMHIIDLRLKDGTAKKCILRDVQFDPVTDRPVHFDLQGLKENERLTIEIPIVLTGGIPKGVRDGGMLQHVIHKLKASCLPRDIPEKIEVNVAELGINQSIHVSALVVPNVAILESADSTVVAVVPPTILKEPTVAAPVEEEVTEPEVVGKGKKAEEGEEGAEPAEAKPAAKEKEKEQEKEKEEKKKK